jgi:hypothetical protein
MLDPEFAVWIAPATGNNDGRHISAEGSKSGSPKHSASSEATILSFGTPKGAISCVVGVQDTSGVNQRSKESPQIFAIILSS